uniref:RNA-directed DNA polymerase, eukaryota, reverse transcriptase zinc-binding domain protein n=1 Tax=Tanacetum cinerariifolium TaxID=118510 RepID=A0A6L2L7F4_TANCI|nr:RNA-directed DNA polymerase, eukaryota, reverse transcriptase zinc-binding domain protein [Tanacetum cinerariifolium]
MSNDGLVDKVDAIGEDIDECQTKENLEPTVVASEVNKRIKESKDDGIKGKENVMDESEISNGLDNKLNLIPTEINVEGIEVVIFDEEIVSEGSNPLIKDQKTTQMCKEGYGRLGFARVLIDVEAEKGLPDKIDIVYKNTDGLVTAKKSVDVNYDWSPQNKEEFEQVRHNRKDGKKMNQNGVKKFDEKGTNSNTVFYKLVVKESNVREEIRKEVEHEKMIDKGSPKTGWKEACKMINEVSSKEIKEALFDIDDDNKALGPDGKLLKELNATLITLVPKVSTLTRERRGYFKGCTRLRQGDPLSPYLLTLVMKVFNLISHQEILRNGSFKYHHGCKELEITHLCFADDLLVLCHGDINSVQVIKDALEKFSVVSGLYPNLGKSTISMEV